MSTLQGGGGAGIPQNDPLGPGLSGGSGGGGAGNAAGAPGVKPGGAGAFPGSPNPSPFRQGYPGGSGYHWSHNIYIYWWWWRWCWSRKLVKMLSNSMDLPQLDQVLVLVVTG